MSRSAAATAAARRAAPRRRPARERARVSAPPASPRVVPRAPRRVSGPARQGAGRRGRATVGARALGGLGALPDHGIIVRLVRGRLWIGLLGCLLLGLVAMQVSLLKLNASIGRAVQQGATLERRNGELRATISRLGSEERIQSMGARLGLIMPDGGRITYLATRRGQDAGAAIQALKGGKLGTAAPVQAQSASPSDQSAAPNDQPAAPSDQSASPNDQSAAPSNQAASPGNQSTTSDPGPANGQPTGDPAAAPAAGDSAGAAGGTGAQG